MSNQKHQCQKTAKGFTIIEVVLVLAIAGLIFLMVFVALPALQRNQRDTQRRDDMARFIAQLAQYQTNNNGKVPEAEVGQATDADGNTITTVSAGGYMSFIHSYLKAGGDTFDDPSTGTTYLIDGVTICTNSECPQQSGGDALGLIHVYTNATCEGENPKYVQGDRKVAITINLEGAGIYCGHN